jgi:ABC-type sugar transport system substrate-binding protein
VAAIAQAGKASSLKLVSSDLDPPAFALLKAGSVHTLTAASQEWGALATVDAAFRGLENKPIPSSDAWGIGVGLVTAANAPRGAPSYVTIDRYVQRKLNFVAPYQKAWGVDLSSVG